ncbi:MAG: dockerin type I repeat-containing protein [Clostridia bacterium]|nr:dockerin type I repeat-containing protein [Clostridia bacterium]
MKKIIALVLAIVLSTAMLVPANAAADDTYMIFAGETDDGCGIHPTGYGRLWGPVGENADLGHPAPVQGNSSYCVNTTTNQTIFFHNTNWNYPATTTGIFDATKYEYIEFDIYVSSEIVCNFDFGLCSDEADPQGACWNMNSAWIPGKRWTHIRMPIADFGGFTAAFGGSLSSIKRIKVLLTNIVDGIKLVDDSYPVAPDYTYVYIDNVVATRNGAGRESELIDLDTLTAEPPEWFDEYRKNYNPIVIAPPAVVFGDTDGNKKVDASDALNALQHSVGKITLSGVAADYADVDASGVVDATDALHILQYSVEKINKFPREVVGE